MLGKPKHYIISPKDISSDDLELVGEKAVNLKELHDLEIPVPEFFVLTSVAFDDFVIAANLVEKVGSEIARLNDLDETLALQVSEHVQEFISQSSFPSTILSPLVQAYRSLSGISEKYVDVYPAWIFGSEMVPLTSANIAMRNVKGEASLLYAVKQMWGTLFNHDALLHRFENKYRGGLSLALVIQKSIPVEASGLAYSVEPTSMSKEVSVVEARLGLSIDENMNEPSDIYKVDNSDQRIIEKNIAAQEMMFVRKAKNEGQTTPYLQVPISGEWRRRQKLEDPYIHQIAKYAAKLHKHFREPMRLEWGFEVGKLFILDAQKYTAPAPMPELSELDMPSSLLDKAVLPNIDTELDLPEQGDKHDKSEKSEKSKPELKIRQKKVNIKELVDEVTSIASQLQSDVSDFEKSFDEPNDVTDEKSEDSSESATEAELDHPLPTTIIPFKANKLITQIIIDGTNADSDTLSNIENFGGVFINGKQLIQNHSVLPETLLEDQDKLNELLGKLALDIGSIAKVAKYKQSYYRFGDFTATELESLGAKSPEADLAQRFIEVPGSILSEVVALKKAKFEFSLDGIHVIIPGIRDQDELAQVKKIISSQNWRRNQSHKLFLEISLPAQVYQLESLSTEEIDGVVINLPQFVRNMTHKNLSDRSLELSIELISDMLDIAQQNKWTKALLADSLDDYQLELLFESAANSSAGIDVLMLGTTPTSETLQHIATLESELLDTPEKKPHSLRGRRPKPLR